MKMKLIMPHVKEYNIDNKEKYLIGQEFKLLPLNLAMLAALTKAEMEISIVDEAIEQINFDESVDLVGITSTTAVVTRAYEIAEEYRKRGVKVLLGGTHPTLIPREAIRYADSVCIGEAEGLWGEMLADFKMGKLNQFYHNDGYCSMKELPIPRRDLFDTKNYLPIDGIQISRGCPFACDFLVTVCLTSWP